jgi:sulfur-carrier protein
MKINFYATLRPIAGQKTVEFDLPSVLTVRELVEAIVIRFPPMRKELLDENGELYRHVHVFVNGRDAPYLSNAVDTRLQAGDKVDVFPAVGGG